MESAALHIINQTPNGKVWICDTCNSVHIEFKNLNFNFEPQQFKQFVTYMSTLNGEEWEQINKNSQFSRKIVIPIGNKHFNIMLNNTELIEIKNLLKIRNFEHKDFQFVKAGDIEYKVFLN